MTETTVHFPANPFIGHRRLPTDPRDFDSRLQIPPAHGVFVRRIWWEKKMGPLWRGVLQNGD